MNSILYCMTVMKKSSSSEEHLLVGGDNSVEIFEVRPGNLRFMWSILDVKQWGIGSMKAIGSDLYLLNGESDKIAKYRANPKNGQFYHIYDTENQFSWPLPNCFEIYEDQFENQFIVGIQNGEGFKNILVERVLPNQITNDYAIFKDIHKKTICNIVYNKRENFFVSGGRDLSIQIWSLVSQRMYTRTGKALDYFFYFIILF